MSPLIQGNALHLPLADGTVDLVVTSPPYFGLRSYTDGGKHYAGQVGSEPTPGEFVDALIAATREMIRVLKPSGSIWVNLGDKYVADNRGSGGDAKRGNAKWAPAGPAGYVGEGVMPRKSLMCLPWRYAIRCVDDLGLILRAEVIWSKPNGLPESVTDRVRRSHEQWFHFTKEPRYFSAVDEIREEHAPQSVARSLRSRFAPDLSQDGVGSPNTLDPADCCNPLGKLPGSVWSIPTQPLTVPAYLGVEHFAAFPMEWPRRLILAWSPPGICTACGEGRRPTVADAGWSRGKSVPVRDTPSRNRSPLGRQNGNKAGRLRTGTGYVCACTPYTDHPGSGESSGPSQAAALAAGGYYRAPENVSGYGTSSLTNRPKTGPRREYHHWTPAPTRPAVVLDPFGGTGTTALVAAALGRTGISVDMSADYCRLARWRTTDPGQRAAAMQVEKPAPVIPGQASIFEDMT